ncbi:expansin EXLX1 family cellulose-binding protein [Isoptericola croceus]|uniref:expansin EXLX1 family cellulose-binding protein n=1 Tax=Isoptericola croceus TaxID=3031406 RepID=UPI0023FA3002|nr:expansin EXLX1 family cellulose-binding protein [Isoptericola croceus]
MKTVRHAARQSGRWYRLVWGAVVAVAVVGGLSYPVMAAFSDGADDSTRTAAAPATTPQVSTPTPTPTGTPTPTATPTPTDTPTPTASVSAPSARPSPTPPRESSTTAASAGRIRPGTTYEGDATHYEAADGNGACLFGPSDDMMIAAMNETDYEISKACGAHVLVQAANGASVTVRITNVCPLPCAPGQLDLSKQAFAELADPMLGRIPITWSLLSPGTTDTISIRYKDGSSQYWCAIQVIDHRNPVAKLEVETGGGWRPLTRTEYNYFRSEDGSGCGGPIRITDIYGERLTVSGLAVRADVVQPTKVQFAQR